jgi:hypothetical protein
LAIHNITHQDEAGVSIPTSLVAHTTSHTYHILLHTIMNQSEYLLLAASRLDHQEVSTIIRSTTFIWSPLGSNLFQPPGLQLYYEYFFSEPHCSNSPEPHSFTSVEV